MRITITIIILFVAFFSAPADLAGQQIDKKKIRATRITNTSPKIDGNIEEGEWNEATEVNEYFYQIAPDNGAQAKFKTSTRILYTDNAIYFGFIMYDDEPKKIPAELGQRDDGDKNTDQIGVLFDTYNNGQNALAFIVTAAGVQIDVLFGNRNEDVAWDAVWNSAVQIHDEGWTAEFEIPYSAIRFPKQEIQTWGINFYRISKRFQEESSWNFINAEIEGFINQSGELNGLEGIKPPLRLSFMPYVTAIYKRDGLSGSSNKSLAGGMDLKYGINESFTLDMSLIPDFSQVRTDNLVLNLSPFEVRYDENRPFFTEGMDMFEKGGIFYSRRVGQNFRGIDQSVLSADEVIESTPATAPLINASKISGRTKKGTGIGFFNAVTNHTYAEVRDTLTDVRREILVDPLTNFNVMVVDQNLKNNSNIGIINTNVYRGMNGRKANVTVVEGRFRDKTNTWSLSGSGGYSVFSEKLSEIADRTATSGYRYNVSFSKISGQFQFSLRRNVESDTYEINDLGFQRRANEISHNARVEYNIFKPFSIFNRLNTSIRFQKEDLFLPREFTQFSIGANAFTQFKNFWNAGFFTNIRPIDSYDYFEPRVWGKKFRTGPSQFGHMFVSSDSRKRFSGSLSKGLWRRNEDHAKMDVTGIGLDFRASNKLSFSLNGEIEKGFRHKGFVNYDDVNDIVYFGSRNVKTIENLFSISYTFNNKMGLTVRSRNYWSTVNYQNFYTLNQEGRLDPSTYTGLDTDGITSLHNRNYDAFTVDILYFWQIAPGSFLNIFYKNITTIDKTIIEENYFTNINNTFETPGLSTLSIKLIYFLDYERLF